MPDFTDTTDTTGAPETSDSTDASNINSIYDQDPSTWDLDTRSTAAIGDLYDMVGNHVDTYGEMPDQQTIDGFNNTVNQRWGLPDPNAPYPSQTDGGAVQPLPATINDPNDNAGSVASMADAAAAQTGEQPDDAAENDTTTDQPQDQSGDQPQPAPDSDGVDAPQPPVQPAVDLGPQPSTQPSKPANPKLAATDTGTMSDATNDIRNPATLNQRAQNGGAQTNGSGTGSGRQSKQEAQQQARVAANEEALKNPNVRAMLDTIGQAEGAKYNTRYGGGTFDDYSKHPALDQQRQTPSGKYQITAQSYKDVSGRLGLTDFSPHTQDIMAVQKLVDRGAIDDIKSGKIDTALPKISHEWSSLPTGPNNIGAYGEQTPKSYDEVMGNFKKNRVCPKDGGTGRFHYSPPCGRCPHKTMTLSR